MKKKNLKKLTLNKESIIRLDPSDLREAVGAATLRCTNTEVCTDTCGPGSACIC